MRSKDYTSMLFVITDGLYEKSEKNRILQVVNNCVQSGITVFGIGVGTYPKGIEELFPHIIFSPNPSLVPKCIASIFGDSISNRKEKMPPIYPNDLHIEDNKSSFNNLIKNEDKPIFSNLKEELTQIKHLQDAFRHYLNSEGFTNFEGENAEMYKKNTFQTQKILIIMLWDYTMKPLKESKELQMQYIYENISLFKRECIKTAVEHFGITIDVVQNYKSAIEKLLRQEKNGFCDYYSVWIMCGPPMNKLPDNSSYPNLGQFIEVITQFWKNGGALVF